MDAAILNRGISDGLIENETFQMGTFYFHVNNIKMKLHSR